MVTRTKTKTRRPRQFPEFVAHRVSLESEPTTFKDALSYSNWRQAMSDELNALALNNTWTLVLPPTNQKVIGCKWIFKVKRNPDGSVERYKARLVAKGYNQEAGIDYIETYSPVIRATTIRVILSLAISSNWPLRQLDVSNAFLNGNLNETVYMHQPQGFADSLHPNFVCRLHKSLYGLKQAPQAWFQRLSDSLIQLGFKASCYDPSLFISHHTTHTTLVLVYIDDIIVTSSDSNQIDQCIHNLSSQFTIRDLGNLSYFLGIEVTSNNKGIHLTQTKYLSDLLKRANMLSSKPCLSPMTSGTTLSLTGSSPVDNPHLYRSIVGALQYATLTRPDIAVSVNKASQYMHQPTEAHWAAVKRILRYIAGTLHFGLQFFKDSTMDIHAYSNADWAGNIDDRRSTSGFCIFLGHNLVSWASKKQATVSRSSTEAEYRSLASTCTEILWLQYILKELHNSTQTVPTLWCDNIGATFLAANPMFHARTKHIEIDFHFVRERVASNQLKVRFICSSDQIADIMTKPLPQPRF